MDIYVYNLPTLKDGAEIIEKKVCEFMNLYRSGEKLAPEIMDWLDTANNWLMVCETR